MRINKEDTIEIAKTHNGYLLKTFFVEDQDDKGNNIYSDDLQVYEFDNDEQQKEKIKELLYDIAEQLGFNYNKYEESNLNIDFNKKGHKLD
jgi:hypothetical protein